MYGNSYTGRSNYGRGKRTMVGLRVEKMRKGVGLSIGDICKAVNVAPSIYDSFLEGRYRLDRVQLGRLADVLGVTVHDLFHARGSDATDGDATRKVRPVPSKIRVSSPTSSTRENTAKKARKQRSTMPKEQPYDADAAADLLAKKFKVTRA